MYAFDVHCNSYFPLFLLLYGEPVPEHGWTHVGLRYCAQIPFAGVGSKIRVSITAVRPASLFPGMCSGAIHSVAAVALARIFFSAAVQHAIRSSTGLLPLPQLFGIQRDAFSGSHRGTPSPSDSRQFRREVLSVESRVSKMQCMQL